VLSASATPVLEYIERARDDTPEHWFLAGDSSGPTPSR
jgi:hypothetical protein